MPVYVYVCLQCVCAKLKAVFDRFDAAHAGTLSGEAVEQALVYMQRPVDSAEVGAATFTAPAPLDLRHCLPALS